MKDLTMRYVHYRLYNKIKGTDFSGISSERELFHGGLFLVFPREMRLATLIFYRVSPVLNALNRQVQENTLVNS